MNRVAIVCLLLAPSVLAADDKKPDVKTELAVLKGKWKLTSGKFNGNDLTVGTDRVLVFDEKQFTTFNGKDKGRTLTYTLDPSADPKRIDLVVVGSGDKSGGIYVLDGDTLKVCYAEPGAERPKKLESKSGEKVFLLVLERVKP